MKYLLTVILIAFGPLNDLDRIAEINALKKEAQEAYTNGNYKKALENYQYLVDSMEVKDDNVLLNLANAYYKVKDTTNALENYQLLTDSNNELVRSVAQQQLGVMANKSKKFDLALEHFKEAIKANPANNDARYNYELLKKLLEEQKKQNKEQNKDQNKQDKQDKKEQQDKKKQEQQKKDEQQKKEQQQEDQKKDGEGKEQEEKDKQQDQKSEEEKEGKEQEKKQQEPQDGEESDKENQNKQDQMSSLSDKLKEMKISEEKAKMILQALRNKEIQYYQQNKRKAKEPKDENKPDW